MAKRELEALTTAGHAGRPRLDGMRLTDSILALLYDEAPPSAPGFLEFYYLAVAACARCDSLLRQESDTHKSYCSCWEGIDTDACTTAGH